MRASGTSSRMRAAAFSIELTLLWTRKTWPSRSSSRRIAAVICFSSYAPTKVRTGCRSSGGVARVDISRMPVTAISRVRGIGVADMARTSTAVRSRLELLLVLDAEALLLVDDDEAEVLEPRPRPTSSRWVPMTRSTEPSASPSRTSLASLSVWNRDSDLTMTGNWRVALGEGLQVLADQQRRRHEDRDLLAVLDRLERRPHRDLGLAVADVAADEAVHRDRPAPCRP